jgi:RimJ/RimL family protein N-acetyltransferase
MPAEPPPIHGDGVSLLPVTGDGLDHVLTHDVGGHLPGAGWPSPETAFALAFVTVGGLTWLVVDETGHIVGELGTTAAPDADGAVEIGYGLTGASRGRGLGTRAVAALVDWLSAQPDVRTLVAHVAADNLPSRRVLERLGFSLDGFSPDGEHRYVRAAPR